MKISEPRIIPFQVVDNGDKGKMVVAQFEKELPFVSKRQYWVFDGQEVNRGGQFNYRSEFVLVCLRGTADVLLKNRKGKSFAFTLTQASEGLYIPIEHWREVRTSHGALLMTFCSAIYEESDYNKSLESFLRGE